MHRSPRPSNVEIRADDHALTGHAGLLLTGELAVRTDLVARLDRAIDGVRPFKQQRRGRSGGELLISLPTDAAVGVCPRTCPGSAGRPASDVGYIVSGAAVGSHLLITGLVSEAEIRSWRGDICVECRNPSTRDD